MQRLVALHVDDDVAVERRGDLGEAIGAALVRRRVSRDLAAESLRRASAIRWSSVATITRDDRARRGGAPVDVLDHRPAVDVGERFAGEAASTAYRAGMTATAET